MSLAVVNDMPPEYFSDSTSELFPLPIYSPSLQNANNLLYAPLCDSTAAGNWKYDFKHMGIDLGPRLWGVDRPVYGLNAKVQGTLRLFGSLENVSEASVTFEGTMDLTTPEIGTRSSHDVIFLSRIVNFTSAEIQACSANQNELSFSIPIPSQVEFQGATTQPPPTFCRYYYGFICLIRYSLKVCVVRHGLTKAVDLKAIPVLYFPKSRPSQPPLVEIARPPVHEDTLHTPDLHQSDRIRTYQLSAVYPKTYVGSRSQCKNTMFFSLPSPHCFTSGSKIPFLLSLVFPSDPALGELYFNRIRISLLKRLTICTQATGNRFKRLLTRRSSSKLGNTGASARSSPGPRDSPERSSSPETEHVVQVWQISDGHVKFKSEYSEGVCLYRGFIKTGDTGRECSWALWSAIKVQYILQVTVSAPSHLEDYLPDFELEEPIDLTTDTWETEDRELRSMGGIPVPALGLLKTFDDAMTDTSVV
ncbi:hypothetical protein D9758_001706 [Tetrapyrgos nigripes]|uniref:Arrestin-like N-terminal domain-containing protein n=1 Tax=Tetrapyrgos nigripes TaxID=182062 RepID=A0A8H5GXZ7_9AGAR|nr:hypothetical protein D9758_001706 [Tetrapyrgos nigripes]